MSDFIRRTKAADGAAGVELDTQELALINAYTLRAYAADELFAFRVNVCDNEVDRDLEVFPAATLHALAKALPGKTMLSDHNWKAEKQCARVYAAQVVTEPGKTTTRGEPYTRLAARCYLPRTDDTKGQIELIEAGIRKEVSIGCATRRATCSICKKDYYSAACHHNKGQETETGVCVVLLEDLADVYEISFAAVPIQVAAGVTKAGESADGIRAELERLTGMVKTLCAAKSLPAPPKDTPQPKPDPAVDKLIQSANALVKKIEGEKKL